MIGITIETHTTKAIANEVGAGDSAGSLLPRRLWTQLWIPPVAGAASGGASVRCRYRGAGARMCPSVLPVYDPVSM